MRAPERGQAVKAVVRTRYGPPEVLRLADVPTPVPKNGEVLVEVHAVSLNASDWETLVGKPAYARMGGPFRPPNHILGSDIAGRVMAAGRRVTTCSPTSSFLKGGSRSTSACRRQRWRRCRLAWPTRRRRPCPRRG